VYPIEIVGVVGDMHRQGLETEAIPEYFAAIKSDIADIVVRTGPNPPALAAMVGQAIRSVDRKAIVLSIIPVESQMGERSAGRRFQTWLLALLAALALTLAMVGIYGIMHYAVEQRTHEIGIRIALGARPHIVLRLMIGQGLKLALGGVAAGLIAALWLTRMIAHSLFGVSVYDTATFVGVAVILIAAALVACYLPARKAARVDPLNALRHE
jgi:putative ABC transport system permease protein